MREWLYTPAVPKVFGDHQQRLQSIFFVDHGPMLRAQRHLRLHSRQMACRSSGARRTTPGRRQPDGRRCVLREQVVAAMARSDSRHAYDKGQRTTDTFTWNSTM